MAYNPDYNKDPLMGPGKSFQGILIHLQKSKIFED